MSKEQRGAVLTEPPAAGEGAPVRAGARGGDGRGSLRAPEAHEPHGPPRSVVREYFESLVVTAIMALFGMTFVVQAVKVPTGSMQNTILIGDHLLVNKFIFAPGPPMAFLPQREIRRGDIIVFKYPGVYPTEQFLTKNVQPTKPFETNYVKRVIGLPGDRVEVRGVEVIINGEPLAENRVVAVNPPREDDPDTSGNDSGAPLTDERGVPLTGAHMPVPPEGQFNAYWGRDSLEATGRERHEEVFEVPAGHYFVLGDNRDNSEDSRFWGYVPRELIIGRAMFVYWSYDESAPAEGSFVENFLRNTRWGRTGTLVK
ncbi:MAG TPA: signal peptidase I [Pyrinomonadaceae bacterium]|nr:signal peptidase I [Pyrinomonadaceae bacterium]